MQSARSTIRKSSTTDAAGVASCASCTSSRRQKISSDAPWDKSIELCRESRVAATLALSEYIPTKPPFPGEKFDLIYAFSVFTHLSARSGKAVMEACRASIADNGLMAITIRPQSYWEIHDQKQNIVDVKAMHRDHMEKGFAYTPHGREPIDGDITYGDTSMTLDYIKENWKGWSVAGVEFNLQDAYQVIVFLRPVQSGD
ncbi:class I SAM-dependent methyltransferase [Caballeronia arationis]|nr:class I SAM-dependent methyltransferase [Caballeronia arationis]